MQISWRQQPIQIRNAQQQYIFFVQTRAWVCYTHNSIYTYVCCFYSIVSVIALMRLMRSRRLRRDAISWALMLRTIEIALRTAMRHSHFHSRSRALFGCVGAKDLKRHLSDFCQTGVVWLSAGFLSPPGGSATADVGGNGSFARTSCIWDRSNVASCPTWCVWLCGSVYPVACCDTVARQPAL